MCQVKNELLPFASYTNLNHFLVQDFLLPKLESAVRKAGLEEDSDRIGMAAIYRAKLLDWACAMELPSCLEYAQELFTQWQSDPNMSP